MSGLNPGIDPTLAQKAGEDVSGVNIGSNMDATTLMKAAATQGIVVTHPVVKDNRPLPVWSKGWWRGGTVKGDTESSVTQTLKQFYAAKYTSAGSPVSQQLYTVTAGKTAYLMGINIYNKDVAGDFILRDATSDSGTVKWVDRFKIGDRTNANLTNAPIAFTAGIRFDAGDQAASNNFYIVLTGWEE